MLALAVQAPPGYTVSAAQLQRAVAQHFPLRYPVPGVLNLDLQAPQLRLLPVQNRLVAQMGVEAAGPALRRGHSGSVTVDFALRYEPSDRTVRAVQLHFQNLQFPSLQPAVVELLTTYGPALAAQALQDVVLHQLSPQDLALPDTMGLQPGSITVTDQGLAIGFVNKPL